jgi:hypothetical protein
MAQILGPVGYIHNPMLSGRIAHGPASIDHISPETAQRIALEDQNFEGYVFTSGSIFPMMQTRVSPQVTLSSANLGLDQSPLGNKKYLGILRQQKEDQIQFQEENNSIYKIAYAQHFLAMLAWSINFFFRTWLDFCSI